jgi:hypothetical protein
MDKMMELNYSIIFSNGGVASNCRLTIAMKKDVLTVEQYEIVNNATQLFLTIL